MAAHAKEQAEEQMDFIIAGIAAVALGGYLIYALLYPDKF